MDIKKQIEEVLDSLNEAGFDRGRIETDMGYSENYIDQTLSKGGNKKFLRAMIYYRMAMLQNPIPPLTIIDDKERLIQQIEARRKDAENIAKKLEQFYNDAKSEKTELLKILNKAHDTINEVLKPINEKTEAIEANSKTTLEALARIQNITVADDAVNMAYLDKAQGLAPGTSAATAGTAERAMNNLTEGDDKTNEDHKPGKTSKAKKRQP